MLFPSPLLVKGKASSFSQERMTYPPEESNDGREEKVFDVLAWLATMGSHLLNKEEQMVR
jgi:hypothetical protein